MKRTSTTPRSLNPNALRTRDYALLALLKGATKAAVHVDRRKDAARRACRRPVRQERDGASAAQ
jgi:hypothetical protein